MLRIPIPSDGLSDLDYTKLTQLELPRPTFGFRPEVNNNVVMLFEDEQEAIDFAHQVDSYLESLDDEHSFEYNAAADIIRAIGEDAFVQSYIFS